MRFHKKFSEVKENSVQLTIDKFMLKFVGDKCACCNQTVNNFNKIVIKKKSQYF